MATNVILLALEPEVDQASQPRLLLERNGVSVLEMVLGQCSTLGNTNLAACLLEDEVKKYNTGQVVSSLWPNPKIITFKLPTAGSGCTALYAASELPPSHELLIVSSNEYVTCDLGSLIKNFREQGQDAGVFAFNSINPRYSSVKLNDDGQVIEVSQRFPISKWATTGSFWFSNTQIFIDAAKSMIKKNLLVESQFFVAPVLNEVLLNGFKVGAEIIQITDYVPLKNAAELAQFREV